MVIREDIIASAVKFLQDPSVSSSPIENKIAFLESKNLTQEEVDAALARAGSLQAASQTAPQPAQFGGYQQQPQYGWKQQQQLAPPVPKRDWRDWFIMATVMGGVSMGLYTLTKRYVMPLVAPPTPEKLEQDKKEIDDKFDRSFALIDQLSADTTELKNAEQARTDRLDKALVELETVIGDLKVANRRREDDAQRVRDDVQGLKDSIPRAINSQKDLTDGRLKDLNSELKSLKTLLSQRIAAPPTVIPTPASSTASTFAKSPAPAATTTTATPQPVSVQDETAEPNGNVTEEALTAAAPPKPYNNYVSSIGGSSPFSSGMPAGKATIPAWQMAMQTKSNAANTEASGNGSAEPGSSS